MSGIIKYNNFQ